MGGNQNRAVIYCRVSTQEQVQKDALDVQVIEAVRVAEEQGWQLVDRYIEMESATTAEGRSEYLRLISDMRTDKFDIIVIKSLDRINRNAKNWYIFLDELVSNDKRLYIYMEHDFYRTDNNLLAGIKAILAEQYSRDLSKKINNAHHYRQQNGTTVLITNNTYGYRKNPDKSVRIIPEEAEIIVRMYQLTAQGYGSRSVSILLYNDGILNRNGKQITETTIRRIIRNPLFKGTAVMNKKHFDFEKKKVVNNPKSEWIYHPGMVPAIVDESLWEQANAMMDANRRGKAQGIVRGKQKGLYDFSGKIQCGCCGAPYYKTFRRRYSDQQEIMIEWKCSTYLKNGRIKKDCRDQMRKVPKEFAQGCDNIHLKQTELMEMVDDLAMQMFRPDDKTDLIEHIISLLDKVLLAPADRGKNLNVQECLKVIQMKKAKLLDKLLDGIVSDADYQRKLRELEQQEEQYAKQVQAEEQNRKMYEKAKIRLNTIRERMQGDEGDKIMSEIFMAAISGITVYEKELIIDWNPAALMDISFRDEKNMEHYRIFVEVNKYFVKEKTQREHKKQEMLRIIRENPTITNRELAETLEVSYSMARRWIDQFREKGMIHFEGKGGKGKWVVDHIQT